MKNWDVFISHASEDKEVVARPLAGYLQRAGIRVWLDDNELKIGDSLRAKIDEGLAHSRFGIVILSKHFLQKEWPQRELNGLMALEEGGYKVILPVWYGISKRELSVHSPILADKLAADASNGVQYAAKQLLPILLDPQYGGPATQAPSLSRRLALLIENATDTSGVYEFLEANPLILGRLPTYFSKRNVVIARPCIFGIEADFCVGSPGYTERLISWTFYRLAPVFSGALFTTDGAISPAARSCVQPLKRLLQAAAKQPDVAHHELLYKCRIISGYEPLPHGRFEEATVFAGRREELEGGDANLRAYNERMRGRLSVTTYDRLIDTAQNLTIDPD